MGQIKKNIKVAHAHHLISISLEENSVKPKPGQFYMLRCSTSSDPLLRRPFSVHDYHENPTSVDFLFRIVGIGTTILSKMREGDHIEILGPLGKAFDLPKIIDYALFIAGGIGIAPLNYLAEHLMQHQSSISAQLLLGARQSDQILALEKFRKLGFDTSIYTEDGSLGERGCITDDLDQVIKPYLDRKSIVFACGPIEMLAKVAKICLSNQIPCQVDCIDDIA